MNNSIRSKIIHISILFILTASSAFSQFIGEVEGSFILPGYNDIRIPGDGGTLIKAGEELNADQTVAFRARLGFKINERHTIFLLVAPLKINYSGSRQGNFTFFEENFVGNTPFDLEYVFNSYRITYRYSFVNSEKWEFAAGATAKIRDAYIQVKQGNVESKKDNVGFVPIINIYVAYWFSEKVGLVLEGDGLASPQGRAFDFQLAVPVYINESFGFKANYRVLEGGADNDEVYNFTWVNYISAGLFYKFY